MKSDFIEPEMLEHVFAALMPTNALICRLCLETGLRVGDVVALRTARFKQRLSLIEQKTGKRRIVYIRKRLFDEVLKQAGRVFVFPHRFDENKHRTRQAVYLDLKRAAKAFRVKKQLSPHSLRKVFAVELFEKTGDVSTVQNALNHDNDFVTLLYAFADKLSQQKKRGIDKPRKL